MVEAVRPLVVTAGKLLLVNEEQTALRAMERALRPGGWLIESAPTAHRALEIFKSFAPEVVISGFRLPRMNGVEFLNQVRQLSPRAQRILLARMEDQDAIEAALSRSDSFRFVLNPWNDAQLFISVKNAFDQFAIAKENERLQQLTQKQGEEFRRLSSELEDRIKQRTQLLIGAKREWEMSFDSIDLPLAVVHGDDFGLRRANLAYARAAQRPIQDIASRPQCHQFLFGRSDPCTGCPLSSAMRSGQERHA